MAFREATEEELKQLNQFDTNIPKGFKEVGNIEFTPIETPYGFREATTEELQTISLDQPKEIVKEEPREVLREAKPSWFPDIKSKLKFGELATPSIIGGAISTGIESGIEAIGGGIRAIGELTGNLKLANYGKEIAAVQREIIEQDIPGGMNKKQQIAFDAISSAVNNLTVLLPSLMSGAGAGLPITLMTLQSGASKYQEAREKGFDPKLSAAQAAGYGIAEGIGEMFGVGKTLDFLKSPVAKRFLHMMVGETFGELTTETLQSFLDKFGTEQDLSFEDFGNRMLHTLMVTPLSTLIIGGTGKLADLGIRKDITASEALQENPDLIEYIDTRKLSDGIITRTTKEHIDVGPIDLEQPIRTIPKSGNMFHPQVLQEEIFNVIDKNAVELPNLVELTEQLSGNVPKVKNYENFLSKNEKNIINKNTKKIKRLLDSGFDIDEQLSNMKFSKEEISTIKELSAEESTKKLYDFLLRHELKYKALGFFSIGKGGQITLRSDIAENPVLASKVLAHEIGHLNDFLPDETLGRGNILGRIASLKKYLKTSISKIPDSAMSALTTKARNRIRNISKKTGEDYQLLISKELKNQGLISKNEIMNELKSLTNWWTPFRPTFDDNGNPADNYTKYRYSSKELYADAISVLLNSPTQLEKRAPKFYETFTNYLENKPEFKRIYNEILDDINSGNTVPNLVIRTRKDYREADKKYIDKVKKDYSLSSRLQDGLIDSHSSVISKVKNIQEKCVPAGNNPIYKLEDLRYSGSEVEHYMNKQYADVIKDLEENGIDFDSFGEYLELNRVINERAKLFNPRGWTTKTANERLNEIKKDSKKYTALENSRKNFWRLRKENIIEKIKESRMFKKELVDKIDSNEFYATFDVVDYIDKEYGTGVGSKIHKQIGTLKAISNPGTSTIMKDISLIYSINRNIAAKSLVDFNKQYYPTEIQEAKMVFNGKTMQPKKPSNTNLGLITYMEDGKVKGYYINKRQADIFEFKNEDMNILIDAINKSALGFKTLFTELNYGFYLFNAIRDYFRSFRNLPGYNIKDFTKEYIKAFKPSYQSVVGITEDVTQEMLKGKMLISIANTKGLTNEDRQIERLLKKYNIKESEWNNKIIKQFGKLFQHLNNIGRTIERAPKVAGYKILKEKYGDIFTDEEIAHMIRGQIGSPDFLRKGKAYPIYNSLIIFSNAMKEGYRGDYESFSRNRSEFMIKQAGMSIIPKILTMAAVLGFFGDDIKDIFDKVSDYDKSNYNIIPLGLDKNNKAVYLRVPIDETSRFVGGLLWKSFNINKKQYFTDLLDFTAGQFPGINPIFTIASNVADYAKGNNPYDFFRGRPVLSQQIFEAGGWESHKKFLQHLANVSGSGIVYRFNTTDIKKIKTELEIVLDFPVLSNIVGRFIKVSDYGLREQLIEEKNYIGRMKSRESLKAKRAFEKIINGKDLNDEDVKVLMENPDFINRNYEAMMARKYGDVYMQEFMSAKSKEEKAAVLKIMFEKEMSKPSLKEKHLKE